MNTISKFITIIVVIVLVMVGIFYILGEKKDASVMDLRVDVYLDNDGYLHITLINGTVRPVNKISMPTGDIVETPGVVANVIYNEDFIGYWTSTRINESVPLNSTTTYNLTVGLFKNPVPGDNVSVSVRLVGFYGEELDSIMTTFKLP